MKRSGEPSLPKDFRSDGFVVLRRFFTGQELDEVHGNVVRFLRTRLSEMPREHVFYEDRECLGSLKQLQHMQIYDAWFAKLLVQGPLRELAEQLVGPVLPKNLQYFDKPNGVGKPTPPHQDGYYFMIDPPEAVTLWLALDSVNEENGCVRYIPGSHRRGMRPHRRTNTLGFSQGISDFPCTSDTEREVAVVAAPGDLLAHHAMTIHRADRNRSPSRSRRALGFIYYSAEVEEDTSAHSSYQEQLARDLRDEGKI